MALLSIVNRQTLCQVQKSPEALDWRYPGFGLTGSGVTRWQNFATGVATDTPSPGRGRRQAPKR